MPTAAPPGTPSLTTLKLSQLKLLPEIQIRSDMRTDTIQYYTDLILEGSEPPPLSVRQLASGDFLLADGWHRYAALGRAGRSEAVCTVQPGTKFDALLDACTANSMYGLTLTRADRRRAAELLLCDPVGYSQSNRQIAKLTRLTHPTVGDIREEMYGERDVQGAQPDLLTLDPRQQEPIMLGNPDEAFAQGAAPEGWVGLPVATHAVPVTGHRANGSGQSNGQGQGQAGASVAVLVLTWTLQDGDSGSADTQHWNEIPNVVKQALRRKLI